MTEDTFFSYNSIPGFQNLFLDYLYDFEKVDQFYQYDFRDTGAYPRILEAVCSKKRNHITELPGILTRQYDGFLSSERTQENINKLGKKNTVVIITGQQLGIFGGPLYAVYKTLTAIKLAEQLNDVFADYNFVPVFWLAGDDHDLEEVSGLHVFDTNNQPSSLYFGTKEAEAEEETINRKQVGTLPLGDIVSPFIDAFKSQLRTTDFTDELVTLLTQCYQSTDTFASSFRKLWFNLFDQYGLVILDPQDPEIKKIMKPVYAYEAEHFRRHSEALIMQSAELEEIYHAQVKVRPINLFMLHQGERFLVEPNEENYRLRRKKVHFTKEELMKLIDEHPERFSGNALLRPVSQDFLLPTFAYIAGPAEISYYAQIKPLYESFGVPMPLVYPRVSMTLLEKGVQNFLSKYDFSIYDVFVSPERFKEKYIGTVTDLDLNQISESSVMGIQDVFKNLEKVFSQLDPGLSDAVNKQSGKAEGLVKELFKKATDAQKKKHEVVSRQAEKAIHAVMPLGELQERTINYFYFVNKYGPGLMRLLYDQAEIAAFEHQIVKL